MVDINEKDTGWKLPTVKEIQRQYSEFYEGSVPITKHMIYILEGLRSNTFYKKD